MMTVRTNSVNRDHTHAYNDYTQLSTPTYDALFTRLYSH